MVQDSQPANESYHPQDVVFINTHLIQRAMEGLQKSKEEFQTLLEQAELGEFSVQYDLAVRYLEGDGVEADPVQAVRWLSQAAELGDLRALEALARCYQFGTGVELDEARAAELYRQCAEQDYVSAVCDLGLCYENGAGVEHDPVRAA